MNWLKDLWQKIKKFIESIFKPDEPVPTPEPELDPTKWLGVGFDRNGDLLDPVEVADQLVRNGLNCTSVGIVGRDNNDPFDMVAVRKWLPKWIEAMRAKNIVTIVTLTGTGGPDGGLGRPQFSDDWFNSMLDVMIEIGTDLVVLSPYCEGNIKEGAQEPAKSKIRGWANFVDERWTGMKGWNYQCNPKLSEVPTGYIGIYHPQRWDWGYAGQVCITDAPISPRFMTGDYPNEQVIPDQLEAIARQTREAGKGFIKWGQWEHAEIETAAIEALGKVSK